MNAPNPLVVRLCKCHGEPMLKNGGGNWKCGIKTRARGKRYASEGKSRLWTAKKRAEYRSQGLCRDCGHKALTDRIRCGDCSEKAKAQKKKQEERYRSRGVCTNCLRSPIANPNGWWCNRCLDRLLTPENLMRRRRHEGLKRKSKRALERSADGKI